MNGVAGIFEEIADALDWMDPDADLPVNPPPEAIRPLRERLTALTSEQQKAPDPKRAVAIEHLRALIQDLENQPRGQNRRHP